MFEPERIPAPDKFGFFCHPDFPDLKEGESGIDAIRAMGYECHVVEFEWDADEELLDAYYERNDPNFTKWEPTYPDGDGWILAAKFDTENGPYALFVRSISASKKGGA